MFKYGDSPIDYDKITCELKANIDKCFAEQRSEPKSGIVIFLMPSVDCSLISMNDLTSMKVQGRGR